MTNRPAFTAAVLCLAACTTISPGPRSSDGPAPHSAREVHDEESSDTDPRPAPSARPDGAAPHSSFAADGGLSRGDAEATLEDAAAPRDGAGGGQCGGFLGTLCPEGEDCVDDPSDACDPKAKGRDCVGFCKAPSRDGG